MLALFGPWDLAAWSLAAIGVIFALASIAAGFVFIRVLFTGNVLVSAEEYRQYQKWKAEQWDFAEGFTELRERG